MEFDKFSDSFGIGWKFIVDNEGVKTIQQILNLSENMEVSLLLTHSTEVYSSRIGVFVECSPRGFLEGFRVPHGFCVVMKLVTINDRFTDHVAYCKMPNLVIMHDSIGIRFF